MGSQDKMWWTPSKKRIFKVKDYFGALSIVEGSGFPWKSAWKTKSPTRDAFSMWSAALEKILTLDNLRKRHVVVINKCYMCKKDESQSIIYSFIARWPMLCSAVFLADLVFFGSCLVVFWDCVLASVPLVGLRVLWFEKWCIFVSFGPFGGKETIGVLKTWKALWKRS
jgi:hypothetical protein